MHFNQDGKQKNAVSDKPKDYKKLSKIKSIIFLILAVFILGGMYLKEQPGKGGSQGSEAVQAELKANYSAEAEPNAAEAISTETVKNSLNEQEPQIPDSSAETGQETNCQTEEAQLTVTEDGTYADKEHVALYLHTYGKLPSNYITKTKAKKAGWDPEKGNLQEVLPGMSIGGGGFQNEEELLPEKEGRSWYECDIDYEGGERNGKRIVWSSDGLIYYTEDHYASFEQLYGN